MNSSQKNTQFQKTHCLKQILGSEFINNFLKFSGKDARFAQ
jgi:hypothetical protein